MEKEKTGKTIKVRRKLNTGTHTYMPEGGESSTDLVTIKGGETWECPEKYVQGLDPAQWDILDSVEEAGIGGPSRRKAPTPELGLKIELCPDQDGMYDVINEKTGKRVNDDPLTKEEADSLVKESK